jgi:hypothetical protein
MPRASHQPAPLVRDVAAYAAARADRSGAAERLRRIEQRRAVLHAYLARKGPSGEALT